MKLRTKIFLTFSILATVPLLLFTVFCYQRYTQTTYERMDVISSHLFENARNAANDTLDTIRQTAGTFNFYYNDGTSIISDLKEFKDSDSPPDTYEYFKMSQSFKRTCQNLLYSDPVIFLTVQMMKTERSSPVMIFRMQTGIRIHLILMVHFM